MAYGVGVWCGPPKIMIAYKLLRVRKDKSLGPLFINRRQRIPVGKWLVAKPHRTPGYAFRPGWHCCSKPVAPHLSKKGRRWYKIDIGMMHYEEHRRPQSQGGMWYVAEFMKVIGPVLQGHNP